MPSIFWYCSLAVIGTGILAFTMYKKKNFIDLFSFFLFATTVAVWGEVIVLFLFDAYSYKPGIFIDPSAENILGHALPNIGLWAPTAVLIGAFSLSFRWIFLISIAYMIVEIIFLKLGIYEHHWWRTYMTGIATILYFTLIKIWYYNLKENPHWLLRYITFLCIACDIIHIPIFLLLLLGKQYFSIGWFANIYRDSTVFSVIYDQILAIIFTFFVCKFNKGLWKLAPIVFFLFSDSILIKHNILILQDGWCLFYLILVRTLVLAIFILLERYSLNIPLRKIHI